jgi:hypothetical protein
VATSIRAYVFLDSLQPQLSALLCTTSRGFFPVPANVRAAYPRLFAA